MMHYLPLLLGVLSVYCLGFFSNWLELVWTQLSVRRRGQYVAHRWVHAHKVFTQCTYLNDANKVNWDT